MFDCVLVVSAVGPRDRSRSVRNPNCYPDIKQVIGTSAVEERGGVGRGEGKTGAKEGGIRGMLGRI